MYNYNNTFKKNCRVVFYSPDMLKHPFSITLFEDWMYWSDWDRNAIFKADKFTGKNAQAVTSTHLVRSTIVKTITFFIKVGI